MAAAWAEGFELSYPLETRGQDVPLRIRTDRLESDEAGALVANGATLTTCSHEVPHFVVRTRKFSLSPRDDGRWRFAARGNRPSIPSQRRRRSESEAVATCVEPRRRKDALSVAQARAPSSSGAEAPRRAGERRKRARYRDVNGGRAIPRQVSVS